MICLLCDSRINRQGNFRMIKNKKYCIHGMIRIDNHIFVFVDYFVHLIDSVLDIFDVFNNILTLIRVPFFGIFL